MNKHDCFSPIKFCENIFKCRISQILPFVTRQKPHPIEMQGVQRVLQFEEGSIHIGKGECGKGSKPLRVAVYEVGRVVVESAGQVAC
jgi:hypothetical protein